MEEFLEYWCKKWPGSTRNLKILEQSAHFCGCRDAWFAARKEIKESPVTAQNSAMDAIALVVSMYQAVSTGLAPGMWYQANRALVEKIAQHARIS